ncbi:monofunctional biosynthetic peptidoglycan transglycosylase [Paucibacter oligotrophus]|uniref:Biosynthetic peptidoglycan transglycosylase n=1 Tax=Roseateles oligotrophus TaxID=1769250 RepID=A0A840LC35_9BURK|nr:transglycosylase domain-containing protein [Roseateles oligotrophus]MBB4845291.1 monofunctional biosynthetic peptidoglycan transglycosylase [Roseateles oligotrophus]
MKSLGSSLLRLAALLLLSLLALQLYFAGRIALMNVLAPQSTSFERSEIWRLAVEKHEIAWSQQWVDGDGLSNQLKRAVIASEDAAFVEHSGVDWDALEKAWEKNQKAQALAEKRAARLPPTAKALPAAKIVGGSTITQQLAKNLFLSGERNLLRKGQEFLITLMLEGLLGKDRILEIYLNHVEWGEGVFGAQAAARHYFRVDAGRLSSKQAARLAVMLPAPKRFEKRPGSDYLLSRAATIEARMPAVELP